MAALRVGLARVRRATGQFSLTRNFPPVIEHPQCRIMPFSMKSLSDQPARLPTDRQSAQDFGTLIAHLMASVRLDKHPISRLH
jgi:hypothetical protein